MPAIRQTSSKHPVWEDGGGGRVAWDGRGAGTLEHFPLHVPDPLEVAAGVEGIPRCPRCIGGQIIGGSCINCGHEVR